MVEGGGFVGVLLNEKVPYSEELLVGCQQANQLINHRGPDEAGFYRDDHIALVFHRLSIIDLERGQQPFLFGDDRYRMVFNGEIYKCAVEEGVG